MIITSQHTTRQRVEVGILFVIAAFALSVWIWFALRPLEVLVSQFTADDMFYYLQIARNIAAGYGSSFDGLTATNGFHPVYMMILVTAFKLFPHQSPSFFIYFGLIVLSVASALTGVMLFLILRRLCGIHAAFVVSILWFGNPLVMGLTHTGVEVALAGMMFSVSIWLFLRYTEAWSQREARWFELYFMGCILGLTCLCRTDSMFFALGIGFACVIYLVFSRYPKRIITSLLLLFLGGATLIFPWFLWNLLRFGSVVQDSARALHALRRTMILDTYTFNQLWDRFLGRVMYWLNNMREVLGLPHVWTFIVLLVVFVWLVIKVTPNQRTSQTEQHPESFSLIPHPSHRLLLVALLFALVSVFLFYTTYFWSIQKWYFLPPTVCLYVLLGGVYAQTQAFMQRVFRPSWIPHVWAISVLTIFLLSYANTGQRLISPQGGFYPWQKVYWAVANDLSQTLPKTERLGGFNSGILGYVVNNHVVNLDGVVNGQVFRAMTKKALLKYLHKMKVTYIVDHIVTINHFAMFAEKEFEKAFVLLGRYKVSSGKSLDADVVVLKLSLR